MAELENDLPRAIRAYQEAAEHTPARPEAYQQLAALYNQIGKGAEAIAILQAGAANARPTFGLNLRLAQLLIQRQEWEHAARVLAHARSQAGNSDEGWLITAQLELQRGQTAAAMDALARASAVFPENAETHYWLGRTWARLNRCEQARRAYAQAIALAPLDPRFGAAQQIWENCPSR